MFWRIGTEFMPPMDEGSILYMHSKMPGISIAKSQSLLQLTNRIVMRFPEVDHVLVKTGRADTATDPAPLSMLETVFILKPQSERRDAHTWYPSGALGWLLPALRHFTPDTFRNRNWLRGAAPPRSTAAYFLPLLQHPATIGCGPNPTSLQALKAMSERMRVNESEWASPTLSKPDIGNGLFEAVQFIGTKASGYPSWPGVF